MSPSSRARPGEGTCSRSPGGPWGPKPGVRLALHPTVPRSPPTQDGVPTPGAACWWRGEALVGVGGGSRVPSSPRRNGGRGAFRKAMAHPNCEGGVLGKQHPWVLGKGLCPAGVCVCPGAGARVGKGWGGGGAGGATLTHSSTLMKPKGSRRRPQRTPARTRSCVGRKPRELGHRGSTGAPAGGCSGRRLRRGTGNRHRGRHRGDCTRGRHRELSRGMGGPHRGTRGGGGTWSCVGGPWDCTGGLGSAPRAAPGDGTLHRRTRVGTGGVGSCTGGDREHLGLPRGTGGSAKGGPEGLHREPGRRGAAPGWAAAPGDRGNCTGGATGAATGAAPGGEAASGDRGLLRESKGFALGDRGAALGAALGGSSGPGDREAATGIVRGCTGHGTGCTGTLGGCTGSCTGNCIGSAPGAAPAAAPGNCAGSPRVCTGRLPRSPARWGGVTPEPYL